MLKPRTWRLYVQSNSTKVVSFKISILGEVMEGRQQFVLLSFSVYSKAISALCNAISGGSVFEQPNHIVGPGRRQHLVEPNPQFSRQIVDRLHKVH